jgi:hypothetical protein
MSNENSFTPGLSNGEKNEDLFEAGRLRTIDWISLERGDSDEVVIRLRPLAKRVKLEDEKFPPTFTSNEILQIADVQLPDPGTLQAKDVFVDGILPAIICARVFSTARLARSFSVNVPNEKRWVEVHRRNPRVGEIMIGDRLAIDVFGNRTSGEVISIGERQIYAREIGRSRGQRLWISDEDIRGWA